MQHRGNREKKSQQIRGNFPTFPQISPDAINAIKGAWVHGYFAETVNTESAKIAYPSGYTRGNCFVVTGYMNYGGQQKYTIPNHVTAVQDYDDGLTVYHTVASYNRQQVFLLLRKF